MKEIATLKRVWLENYKFKWIEAYQIIQPNGNPLFPYFKKNEAKKFCKEMNWNFIIED